jgi:hypothetical protein
MKKETVYNVSILTSKQDNGHCVSFRTQAEAEACAAHARKDGCYYVRVWEA